MSTKLLVSDTKIIDTSAPCPSCGKIRETVKEDGFTTVMRSKSGNIPI